MFVTRTVKNGRVKIGGKYFAPRTNHLPYDGRLDGMRLIFVLYRYPGQTGFSYRRKHCQRQVWLWGTEEMAKASHQRYLELWDENPCIVSGHFPWDFWDMEGDLNAQM